MKLQASAFICEQPPMEQRQQNRINNNVYETPTAAN